MKIVAQNKKALFDYHILDKIEAGLVLTGDEVKSIRGSKISLVGAFANIKDGELFLNNANITPYERAYQKDERSATRPRKLLLHKRQLNKLVGEISTKGITIVPLKIYINPKGLIKVELGVAKHKNAPSKKKQLKERDIKRETGRELKGAL